MGSKVFEIVKNIQFCEKECLKESAFGWKNISWFCNMNFYKRTVIFADLTTKFADLVRYHNYIYKNEKLMLRSTSLPIFMLFLPLQQKLLVGGKFTCNRFNWELIHRSKKIITVSAKIISWKNSWRSQKRWKSQTHVRFSCEQ